MSNKIEIFQNNTKTIGCIVTGIDLSTYVPYLSVKKTTKDTSLLLSKTGVVTDPSSSIAFYLTSSDTSLNSGDYVYDITVEKGTTIYTIVKDKFVILDGVKY